MYLSKVSDFDENFCRLYKLASGKPQPPLRVPTWVLHLLVLVSAVIDHLYYALFRSSFQDPVTGVSAEMLVACEYLTVRYPLKAATALKYRLQTPSTITNHCSSSEDTSCADNEVDPKNRIIDREEAIRRSLHWYLTKEVLL